MEVQIYTDGSAHTQRRIGGWAAIILWENVKVVLSGSVENTTHNAMEILAVLKALDYLGEMNNNCFTKIKIFSDSQYTVSILDRKEKLKEANFYNKKNTPVRNVHLVKQLVEKIETLPLTFTKVKAHQKKTDEVNYNRVVDKLAREEVRRNVNSL
ncbi:MAG: RNase H family protein [Bacteroidota bacterium]